MAVAFININLLVCITTHLITTKLCSDILLVMFITSLDFGEIVLETFWGWLFFFKISDLFLSRSNTLLAISEEQLVRLMWKEREVHRLNTGWTMWPWPLSSFMALTLDFSRSYFEIAESQELLIWSMWNKKEANYLDTVLIVWLCPLIIHMTLALTFQGQIWNSLISGLGRLIDMEWKGYELSIHDHDIELMWSWWGGWMYWIVTEVTSDIGRPSTYLVTYPCWYQS